MVIVLGLCWFSIWPIPVRHTNKIAKIIVLNETGHKAEEITELVDVVVRGAVVVCMLLPAQMVSHPCLGRVPIVTERQP